MTTPVYGMTDWAAAQASPWYGHNAALRLLEAVARGSIADRDLTAPPGTCADGAAYLVGGSATGLWATHDGEMAIAVGTNAASGWLFAPVAYEGALLWVDDENARIEYDGAAWQAFSSGSSATAVTTQSGTTYTLDGDDANTVILFTNAAGCDVTVPDGVFAEGDFIELHQQTSGTVAVLDNGTSTVNSRDGMNLLAGQYSVAGLRCTATDVFNLTGDLEATS